MNNVNGYVLLHRKFFDMPEFRSAHEVLVFAYMLADAAWQTQERRLEDGTCCTLERGELVVSERNLADKVGMHRNTVSRLLKRLSRDRLLCSRRATGKASNGTIWTIVNYEEYQSFNWYPTEDVGHPKTDDVSTSVSDTVSTLSITNSLNSDNTEEDICAVGASIVELRPILTQAKAKVETAPAQLDLVDHIAKNTPKVTLFDEEDLFGSPASSPSNSTTPAKSSKTKLDEDGATPEEAAKFEEFRKAYPKRKGGYGWDASKKTYIRLLRGSPTVDHEAIIRGAKNYGLDNAEHIGTPMIMMASTFLNTKRWKEHQDQSPEDRPKIKTAPTLYRNTAI